MKLETQLHVLELFSEAFRVVIIVCVWIPVIEKWFMQLIKMATFMVNLCPDNYSLAYIEKLTMIGHA